MKDQDKTLEDFYEEARQTEIRILRSLEDGSGNINPIASTAALAKASAAVIAMTVGEGFEETAMDWFCVTVRELLREQLEEARKYKKEKGYGKEQMD